MTEPAPPSADLATRMLAAYQSGDMTSVLALGEPAMRAGQTDDTVLLLLGAALQSQRRLDDALAAFRLLVERQPAVAEYWNNLAVVARQLGG